MVLRRMCDVMRHRGPDDDGLYVNGNLGLGMRRLSIIDLATGHQPIHNEDRTVWVVLNGEIYNYPEVRALLENRGHKFYTQSDTETIVHLYEEYGDACVQHLNGMFCFALWDDRRKRLLLARDHVGEKQLYYSARDGRIVFGSEIKCLLESGCVSKEMDFAALDSYLAYLFTPAPRTIFRDIRELPPAHILVAEAGGYRLSRYWELEYRVQRDKDLQYFVNGFRERFQDAVRSRLLSDVPLGALLSGGIDSSAIVAAMAQVGAGPIKSYCIGYGDEGRQYDERRYARVVADRFGTDHSEFIVRPQIAAVIPDIVRAFDQPFADSSAVANYYVFQETRKHVTVVLSGLGGDEIGAGYERYLGITMLKYYRRLPRLLREGLIEKVINRLPDSRKGKRVIERIKRFVRTGVLPVDQAYFNYLSAFTRAQKRTLYAGELLSQAEGIEPESVFQAAFGRPGVEDVLNRCLEADRKLYLPSDLLVLTDRMSMAHSIEARAPFLDYRLMEFMASVPPELKIRGLTKKYLVKKALTGLLPDEILHRKKQGFTIPLTVWFRTELNPYIRGMLSRERIERTGLFRWPAVERIVAEHISSKENHHSRIWALLVFMVWHDLYVGNRQEI